MTPNNDAMGVKEMKKPLYTSGFKTAPKYRDCMAEKHGKKWLEALKEEDGVYPYWRIYNKLYDLTEFIDTHPGGKFWLEATQGLDVTDSFETFHMSGIPGKIMHNYYIKDVITQRTSPFTFEENGFYKTLRRKAAPILKDVKTGPTKTMLFIQDSIFVVFILLLICASIFKSYYIMCLAGLVLTFSTSCAHNFLHQKDNVRMYMFDFSLLSSTEWRFTHALLHHNYPNTIHDFEAYAIEPFIKFSPGDGKNFYQRYLAWSPLNVFTLFGFMFEYFKRGYLFITRKIKFQFVYLIQPVLFIVITLITQSFLHGFGLWFTLHTSFNIFFLWLSLPNAHHHPETFVEGDKYTNDKDWGLLQVASTVERTHSSGSIFITALTFGYHTLHHIFPTVDHSKLQHLLEPFIETCKEFGVEYEVYSEFNTLKSYFITLANTESKSEVLKKFKNMFSERNITELSKQEESEDIIK